MNVFCKERAKVLLFDDICKFLGKIICFLYINNERAHEEWLCVKIDGICVKCVFLLCIV